MSGVGNKERMQNAERQEKGKRGVGGLPLESSPYVNWPDLQDYKRRGYGTQDHLEPVEAGKGGGKTDAPTRSGSALNKSPQAMVFDSANPPMDTGKEGGTIDVLLILRLWSSNHPYCWCCSSSGQSLSSYLNRMWSYPS